MILTLLCHFAAQAQYDPDYNLNERRAKTYQQKIESYTKLKRTGIGLGLAGGVLSVTGIVMVSNADWETTPNSYGGGSSKTTNDSEGVTGVLMLLVGVPLAATGIVLGSIGSSKVRKYREKLEDVSLNIDYSQQNKGFTLCYRF